MVSEYLFPELDDEFRLKKLRERWRYEAMARLPVYTKLYHSFTPLGRIYNVDQKCHNCSICIYKDIKILLRRKKIW